MFFGSDYGSERRSTVRAERDLLSEWYRSASVSAPYSVRTTEMANGSKERLYIYLHKAGFYD